MNWKLALFIIAFHLFGFGLLGRWVLRKTCERRIYVVREDNGERVQVCVDWRNHVRVQMSDVGGERNEKKGE